MAQVQLSDQVQPGDVTGYYYIIVCGLPWNCSWKRLKDVCKNQQPDGTSIDVDHVHVYPDETNGWVRVKGKQNFLKMMEHLKSAVIDDRCLMIDGRNETQSTTIRMPNGYLGHRSSHRTRNDSWSSCDTYPSSTTSYYGHRNNSSLSVYSGNEWWYGQPMSPTSSNTSFYQQSPQTYELPLSVPTYPLGDYFRASTPSGGICASNMAITAPVFVTPVPQTPVYTYISPVPYPETPIPPPATSSFIQTEARKIIITQLPRSVSHHDLKQLLLKYIERGSPQSSTYSQYDELHELNIPHSDKKTHGHAFAVLGSEQLARAVIKSLDGLKFQGRVLSARLAKEGVEPSKHYPAAGESSMTSLPPEPPYHSFKLTQHTSPQRKGECIIDHVPAQKASKSLAREEGKSKRNGKERSRDDREGSKKKMMSPMVANGSSGEKDGKSNKHRS